MDEPARIHGRAIGDVAVLTIDNPPVNAGSAAVRRQLLRVLAEWSARPDITALVLIGAGKTFIAGSDLREFGGPLEDPQLPVVIAAIEASPKPVIAALHGAALGGGFELALGCDARIAAPGCVVGLPEVTLGMIPGAGGTQRLPRLVGIPKAIELICAGSRVPAGEAHALGAIDALAEGDLLDAAIEMARRIPKRRIAALQVPMASEEAIMIASRTALVKGKGRPAVAAAIEAVRDAGRLPFGEALQRERQVFQTLRESQEAAALRYQFFAEREAGQHPELKGVTPREISRVGIIGAGTMGSAIAAAFLDGGFEVTLIEQSADRLAKGEALLAELYRRQVESARLKPGDHDKCLARLKLSLDYAALSSSQLVIEAVFEQLEVKKSVLASLSAILHPDTLVATNTSYLDVDAIAAAYAHPQNVLGLHFFSPANVMKLLEIVRGRQTVSEALATGLMLAKRLGKVPVIAGNAFGFIGNRIYATYRRQAEFLIEEGASPAEVDRAMEDFGFAMGPFAVADLSGLDIAWRMRQARAPTRDTRQRYVAIPDMLCERGRFGRKTGAGYYRYREGRREDDPEVEALIRQYRAEIGIKLQAFSAEQIQRRLLLAIVNEAALVLAEGVAGRPEEVDLVLVHGYGFPRWRGGLVFWARNEDVKRLKQDLAALAAISGHDFTVGDLAALGLKCGESV